MDDSVEFTDNISTADALLALQTKLKKNPRIQAAAKSRGIPIYLAKTSSLTQLTKTIQSLMTDYTDGLYDFDSEVKMNEAEKADALEEARLAIEQVVIPKGEAVELLPRPPNIVLLQKDLIRKYKLRSDRVGSDSNIRLRILPFDQTMDEESLIGEDGVDSNSEIDELLFRPPTGTNGAAPYTVDRLPLLPE